MRPTPLAAPRANTLRRRWQRCVVMHVGLVVESRLCEHAPPRQARQPGGDLALEREHWAGGALTILQARSQSKFN